MACATWARLSGPPARLMSALTLPVPRPSPSVCRSSSEGSWLRTKPDMSSHTEPARPGPADGSPADSPELASPAPGCRGADEGGRGWFMCASPPKLKQVRGVWAGSVWRQFILVLILTLNIQEV